MANAKRRKVLDAWAMLAYLQGEPEGAAVRTLLGKAEAGDAEVLMNMVNLGEVYYVLQRQVGKEAAGEWIQQIRQLPMTVVPTDDELVLKAAEVKAEHGLDAAGPVCSDCLQAVCPTEDRMNAATTSPTSWWHPTHAGEPRPFKTPTRLAPRADRARRCS